MDEKKLKALAAELAKGLKTEAELNPFSRMLTRFTVETALNAELADHTGHEKNASKAGSGTRNGYSSKTLLSDDGEIEIQTPRDRESESTFQLIKKNQTRIMQMDSQILSLYLPDIRKALYTTNAIESLNSVIRQAIKKRKVFPLDDPVRKVIYLTIRNASKKWSMPVQNWRLAMSRFIIGFGDRLSDHL
ncbi:transposase [Erwinia tracheiphila]|uniref:Mutator family transposase n=1 Tax=Erwinia tracheiphila TaxID=65700 RepID=A0A0M2KL51_9GAMM|nr:transposase [Erwinia tracheiphila]EOS94071.1 transposase [Erwinia tracheiphila PSU-1]KKF38042.1 hypothetical protein SY86_00435 [Erwinia tracheiphila]UIA89432.1 transposase [Erwinia tracheiphila]UIA97814.1 transposase [Erwinia tracheiphila]